MLSQDVVEIIDSISEKIETNNFDSLSYEEIKNACFMIIGKIEHLKANVPSSDTSTIKELASYKRIIIQLIEWQAKFVEMQKNNTFDSYITDLNFIGEMICTIPDVLGIVYKEKKEKIRYYISSMMASINKLKYKLRAADCFDVALTAHTECTNEVTFLFSKLLKMHHSAKMRYSVVIKGYFEALQDTLDFYLKEIIYFRDLEIINARCLSYCLMNYIPKNVRHLK
jgi:hypothetical protein